MTDRDKVICELSKFREEIRTCDSTTFVSASKVVRRMDLIERAIALLKEQEPRVGLVEGYKPIISKGETKYYQCEICFQPIDVGDNYCRHCGRAVKWDG